MKKKNRPLYIRILIDLAVFSTIFLLIIISIDYFITRERFSYKTYIENIDVSFLSPDEAKQKLETADIDRASASLIRFHYENKEFYVLPSSLGLRIDPQASIKNAFKKVHKKNYLKDLSQKLETKTEGKMFPLIYKIQEEKLLQALAYISLKTRTSSKEAAFHLLEKGKYKITEDEMGRKLEILATYQTIKKGIAHGQRSFPLLISYQKPIIKASELEANPPAFLISAYTTYYGAHDSPNRIHNIKETSKKIDKILLLPNQKFSLIEKVGSFDKDSGLKTALVIVGDELVPMYGGGTCQVATTLFNAASLADLKILERNNHSIWFNIYPLGRDAGIYPGISDLKFENNTNYPIFITSNATNKSLKFKIYGTPTGKQVLFSRPLVTYNKAGETIKGWSIPSGKTPFSTKVTRTVKKGGELLTKETINSHYRLCGDSGHIKIRATITSREASPAKPN